MTTLTKKTDPQTAHLTPEDIEQLGIELDAIRQDILDDRGDRDAAYIRRVIAVQRALELGGRVVLLAGKSRSAWWIGTPVAPVSPGTATVIAPLRRSRTAPDFMGMTQPMQLSLIHI